MFHVKKLLVGVKNDSKIVMIVFARIITALASFHSIVMLSHGTHRTAGKIRYVHCLFDENMDHWDLAVQQEEIAVLLNTRSTVAINREDIYSLI